MKLLTKELRDKLLANGREAGCIVEEVTP